VYAGTVRSSGTAADADAATTTFAATVVDTPLDQGDSGCPLLDANGDVSGILETTKLTDGNAVSIFLPAELVLGVTRQLVEAGTVDPGWMGIDATNITPPAPTATTVSSQTPPTTSGSQQPTGVLIDAVAAGSPAASAGLQTGDTIVAIGGEPVHSMAELRTRLYAEGAGSVLEVTVERSGKTMQATIELTSGVSAVSSSPMAS
jgi:S1-C subfamily serine protease